MTKCCLGACVIILSVASASIEAQAPASASADMASLVKALEGRWILDVSMQQAGASTPATGRGEETWATGLGGLTFVEEERLSVAGNDLQLMAIIWRDKRTNLFHGMQCNNNDPLVCDLKGALNDITLTWDGRQFMIEEQETRPGGDKLTYRETYSDITPTSFTQTGEVRPQGANAFARMMTIHATRAK